MKKKIFYGVNAILLAFVITFISCGGDKEGDTEDTEPSITINVSGRVLFDDGTAVQGAIVSASIVSQESIASVRALWRASHLHWTSLSVKEKKPSFKKQSTPLYLEVLGTDQITTDSSGNYALALQLATTETLPVRVLVEVSYQPDSLPAVQSARWGDASTTTLDMGDITIPAVENTEITLTDGNGQNDDGSIQIEGLPTEVDRFFATSYDPEVNSEAFPGEFTEMAEISLNASVFAWMEGLDAQGNPVQDLSLAATIRTRVPLSQWSDLSDINVGTDRIEIPIYLYNEDIDMWEQKAEVGWLEDEYGTVLPEDAQPTILNGTFSGEIFATYATEHFSWMNVDYPYIGPWTLSRLDASKRNNDCLFEALELAKTIAKSQKGRAAYSKFNKEGGDLDIELADGAGPELKSGQVGGYGEFKGNEQGDRDDQFYMDNTIWDGCGEGATDDQKKDTILIMAVTILHESAHWKWDVKHDDGNWTNAEPSGEAGNELENDLFDGIITDGDGIQRDGAAVDDGTRDGWLDPENWPAPPLGSSIGWESVKTSQEGQSLLNLTISLEKENYDLGEEITVMVVYENISSGSINVLNLMYLEGYPLWFEIILEGETRRIPFKGSRVKRFVDWDQDFVTLQSGETLQKTLNLLRDSQSGQQLYNLITSGNFQITAFYSKHWGLPETQSNTVTFSLNPGGSISGNVTDASTGNPLSGATVSAIQNSIVIATGTTDAYGAYTIPELPGGTYSFEVRASGFLHTTQENIIVTSGIVTTVNFSLSPLLAVGQLRLVLTWGEFPYDLDSHLWLPVGNPYHIYFGSMGYSEDFPYAVLDVDDTWSFGPETITINQFYSGIYRYAIYNFSGDSAITTSQAQVQVFDSAGLIATFNIPIEGEGLWWHVLDINGDTGAITEVNQIKTENPELYADYLSAHQSQPSPMILLYLAPVFCLFILAKKYTKRKRQHRAR